MTSLINKLGWSSVAAITADGERYADYMSSLQDILHYDKVTFKINRKFPPNTDNFLPVIIGCLLFRKKCFLLICVLLVFGRSS